MQCHRRKGYSFVNDSRIVYSQHLHYTEGSFPVTAVQKSVPLHTEPRAVPNAVPNTVLSAMAESFHKGTEISMASIIATSENPAFEQGLEIGNKQGT